MLKKLALGIGLGLAIAACGGTGGETTTTTSSTEVTSTTEPGSSTTSQPPTSTAPDEESMMGSVGAGESSLGKVLVNEDGRTLYIFTVDEGDVSSCYGDCEAAWPPVAADAAQGDDVSVTAGSTTRDDGAEQLTINGRPAYLFSGDSRPGDVNGQGVNGVWFVIGTDGQPVDGSVATADTSLGTVLVDEDGRTLYIFAVDTDGASTCYDQCAQSWPAVASGASLGDGLEVTLGSTTRDDGFEQLTINGRPVYRFAGDAGPGDVNGQNVGEVWFVIGAEGEPISA